MAQIQECLDGEIPIIGFDSGVPNAPDGAIYATASTDNQNAAALAAEKMMEEESFVELVKNATAEAPVVIGVLSQDATGESNVNRTTGFVNRMVELVSEYNEVSVTGHELWKAEKENAPVVIDVEIPATPEVTDITNAASALLNTKGISAIFCSNEGTVYEISVFYTKLKTVDNKMIVIPNGNLSNSSLVNVSHMDKRRVDIVVGIGYEADIRTAKNILYEIGRNDPARLPEEDVVVFVDNLGASSVDLGIRIWVKTADYWDTKWRLMENIKYALDENHISIPYQQIDVQIKQ